MTDRMIRPNSSLLSRLLASLLAVWASSAAGVPGTINIQGTLTDTDGGPLTGMRAYRIQFYDAPAAGFALGDSIQGFVLVGDFGRFSIDLNPPPEAIASETVYYEVGIDAASPPDGGVEAEDLFPDRVKVNSVPFSRVAERAVSADLVDYATTVDHASTAATARGLAGPLSNPGDRIALGDDVFLEVAADGIVELIGGGTRLRLAEQKWFDPRGPEVQFNPFTEIEDDFANALFSTVLNNQGEALIVWRQNGQAFRSHRRGGSWLDPTYQNNFAPSVPLAEGMKLWTRMDDDGDAVIVWTNPSRGELYRSEFREGIWNDPVDQSDGFQFAGALRSNLECDLSLDGGEVYVWTESDGSNQRVFRAEYTEGVWTIPEIPADSISPEGTNASGPLVSINSHGDSVIVWRQFSQGVNRIFRSHRLDGVWTDPSDLSDFASASGGGALGLHIAMNEHGDAILVWMESNPESNTGEKFLFRSTLRDGVWIDPTGPEEAFNPPGVELFTPQAALNNRGDALIVWIQVEESSGLRRVYRSEFQDGVWSHPSGPSDYINPFGENSFDLKAALSDNGDAVIVWAQDVGTTRQVFRSERRGGVWFDPTGPSDGVPPSGGIAENVRLAMNGNGDALIAWRRWLPASGALENFRSEFRFGY